MQHQFTSRDEKLFYVIVSKDMHKRKISKYMSKFINVPGFHIVLMLGCIF